MPQRPADPVRGGAQGLLPRRARAGGVRWPDDAVGRRKTKRNGAGGLNPSHPGAGAPARE
jgi:hypothetical protein